MTRLSTSHQHRILFLLDGVQAVTAGGTERQVLVMAKGLRDAGFDVTVAAFRGTPLDPGADFKTLGIETFYRPADLSRLWQFVSWMRRERFCAVQTFFLEANVIGPWLARWAKVPFIVGSRRNVNHFMTWRRRFLQRCGNRAVDALIANSRAVADSVIKVEGFPARKVTVLYNGINVSRFARDDRQRRSMRSSWNVPDQSLVIGTVAALRPIKGIEQFIAAAHMVREARSNVEFVVVGDGPSRKKLEHLSQQGAAEGHIQFLGSRNDIASVLQGFDVGVLPSLAEGFSNALLEYMAAGLPVIATNVGGNGEALLGTPALLVEPGSADQIRDALFALIDSEARRAECGAAVHTRALQEYDLQRANQRLAEFFASHLADHCGC